MALGWPVASWVQVEGGNRITQQMTRLPSGKSFGGEPEPDPLGLGFAVSGVGDGASARGWGVPDRSLIVRSVVPHVRGSTTGDPLPPSFAGALLGSATVNGVMPSSGPAKRSSSTNDVGV
jgi:hypothetical protein